MCSTLWNMDIETVFCGILNTRQVIEMKYRNLNLKYALINAFYFMLVCGSAGYANNFLQAKGLEISIIGMVLTGVSILALIGQTGMAPIIDRSEKLNEKKFIMFTLCGSIMMVLILSLLPVGSMLVIPFTVLGFSFASMGIPYLNSIAFIYESEGQTINYGLGRGVGSAAYAVAGLLIGQLISRTSATVLPYWIVGNALLALLIVSTLKVPEKKIQKQEGEKTKVSYAAFFRKYSDIVVVIVALICLYFCHMLINSYMINILENIGGTAADQGNATFIQAMVELPPMFLFAVILKKVKVDHIMAFAAVFYSIKHVMILMTNSLGMYYAAMVLQMVSYALIVPATVYFADSHIAPEDRNQGQVLMGATGTIGGLLSASIGGILIQAVGVHTTLVIATCVSVIGTVLMLLAVFKLTRKKN